MATLKRIAIGLAVVTLVSFWLSRILLAGEDPSGWWNFVPAYVFYTSIFILFPTLGLIALATSAASSAQRRCRRRRST